MKVHHLCCGTMCPLGGSLVSGTGSPFGTAAMVCHCLLVETDRGLVLVETGLGHDDIARPLESLSRRFLLLSRPRLDPTETAVRQVAALGFSPDDVRHVIVTHLDVDHAGGLRDFPHAKVHVYEIEYRTAVAADLGPRPSRYSPVQWSHGPDWIVHGSGLADRWFGFEAVRELEGLPPEILLVPLSGHTRGHAGVAVQAGSQWLLHAGDAYFFRDQMDPDEPRCPPVLSAFESLVSTDGPARRHNQARLRRLVREHGDEVVVFSAHDAIELRRCQESGRLAVPVLL
jgi:glyoxylase-like metal-dependent hydrolase (beta-lactamase superfamily II)